jgi:cytoskeletal protein RodZ
MKARFFMETQIVNLVKFNVETFAINTRKKNKILKCMFVIILILYTIFFFIKINLFLLPHDF